ncbi:hypothetical protein R3P38DRAFT_3075682 [Favolaschia claudopus]|uniref:Uncharacterized protein n=1 Tax=Favolaschia claudopus TaxID=2862362 RepID=A0AAV9ZNY7_9AGAR
MGSQLESYWIVVAGLRTVLAHKAVEGADLLRDLESIIEDLGRLRVMVGACYAENWAMISQPTPTNFPKSVLAHSLFITCNELRLILTEVDMRKLMLREKALIRGLHYKVTHSYTVVKPRLRVLRRPSPER